MMTKGLYSIFENCTLHDHFDRTASESWDLIEERMQFTYLKNGAGDALRPFLLHAFGGLYLDMDVQCFAPTGIAQTPKILLSNFTSLKQSNFSDTGCF